MSKSILVTGASGFIGRHLVQALEKTGYHVLSHSTREGNIANCPLPYSQVEHVYHLAAKTFVPESWDAPHAFYETNVLGAVNVLEFCRRQGCSLTLVSSYVYGRPERLPIAEDHPLQPFNPYSHTKILAEEISRYYGAQFGVRLSIVRPFNIYGPGQSECFLIPTLLRQALSRGNDCIEVADHRPKRDYLYIKDLIELLVLLNEHGNSGTYNAGSGHSVSVQELVDLINGLVSEKKKLISRSAPRPEEVMEITADVQKARQELNWEARTPLAIGLRETMTSMSQKDEQLSSSQHQ